MQISLEIAKNKSGEKQTKKNLFSNKLFLVHKQTKIFSFAYGTSSPLVFFFIIFFLILCGNATHKLNNQKTR